MLHIRDENEVVRFGFNFYPLSSKSSIGFMIKISEGKGFGLRYSKIRKRWYFFHVWLNKKKIDEYNSFRKNE